VVLAGWMAAAASAASDTADGTLLHRFMDRFRFLPEYYLASDVSMFFFQKDLFFKERYFVEANTNLSFSLIVLGRLYSIWDFAFQFGMGQTPGNVVFDPMDLNFEITPQWEYRFPAFNLQAGLEHRCFHEIDRKDFPTVYWNKVFIAAGSPNMRLKDYWTSLAKQSEWEFADRFCWHVRAGYFLRDFFGLVAPGKLNGQSDRRCEALADSRFAFYRRRSWIVNIRGQTLLGVSRADGVDDAHLYWRQLTGLEAHFRPGLEGAMFFVDFILDDLPWYQGLPRFSKDRMVQAGFRFFR